MILMVHLQGAASYDVGEAIWQESLANAIHAEAETIVGYAGSDLLESPDQAYRDALRDRLVDEMTSALVSVGDATARRTVSVLADRTASSGSAQRRR